MPSSDRASSTLKSLSKTILLTHIAMFFERPSLHLNSDTSLWHLVHVLARLWHLPSPTAIATYTIIIKFYDCPFCEITQFNRRRRNNWEHFKVVQGYSAIPHILVAPDSWAPYAIYPLIALCVCFKRPIIILSRLFATAFNRLCTGQSCRD